MRLNGRVSRLEGKAPPPRPGMARWVTGWLRIVDAIDAGNVVTDSNPYGFRVVGGLWEPANLETLQHLQRTVDVMDSVDQRPATVEELRALLVLMIEEAGHDD